MKRRLRRALVVLGTAAAGYAAVTGCGGERASAPSPESARPAPSAPGSQSKTGPLAPFVRTDDADAWVRESFVLQKAHARALLVGAGPPLSEVEVPAPGAGPEGPLVKVQVAQTFATIGEALGEAKGGDLVAVRPGRYAGFVVAHDPSMKDGAFVVVRALGRPGEVVIDRGAPADPDWMILVRAGHHLVIDGFAIQGSRDGKGPRAGIMIDGDFRNTSSLAHHVVVRRVWADGHRKWGIHATDSRTVLVEDSFFTRSSEEHGVYVSDGSDDWVLRRNVFFANNAGGLQINTDPVASFDEAKEHPAFADHPPWQASGSSGRAWAEGVLAKGDALFGAHGWPDGRGFNFLVERNVMNENGTIGGAAINLASVNASLFQNNLIYGNKAGGIAMWDNQNPFDEAAVDAPPRAAADATGARIPLFGCRDNRVRNNTVLMDGRRAALQCRNGSVGCALWSNIALNPTGPGLEVFGTSVPGLDVRGNVLGRVVFTDAAAALLTTARTLPDAKEARNRTGIELPAVLAELEAASNVPWLRLDARWPAPSPGRPDFRPRAGSSLVTAGDPGSQPPTDLEGRARAGSQVAGALLPR